MNNAHSILAKLFNAGAYDAANKVRAAMQLVGKAEKAAAVSATIGMSAAVKARRQAALRAAQANLEAVIEAVQA